MATPGYTPKHRMPEEFMIDGIPMAEIQTPRETLEKIKEGEGPDYEVMVVSYPRSGENLKDEEGSEYEVRHIYMYVTKSGEEDHKVRGYNDLIA